ncbi:MAG: SDR family NAD(P)-dependent oxidoreductase [Myxococcota bacterium]
MTRTPSRLAIVTGTSRGLGLAVARTLLDEGWSVLGSARSEAPGELCRDGYSHVIADLSEPAAAAERFEEAVDDLMGRVEPERLGLVNNAGVLAPIAPTPDLGPDDLIRALTVNVAAPVWLMGLLVRRASDVPLRIVNIGSGASTSAYPGWSAYCSTKAALRMAGMVLGAELEEVPDLEGRDVAVVDFAPGVVATGMQERIRATDASRFPRRAKFVELHETGQLLEPGEPAAEVSRILASDDLPPFSERRH